MTQTREPTGSSGAAARSGGSRGTGAGFVLTLLVAGLPWVFWLGWPTRDPFTDLKWPVLGVGLSIVLILSLRAPGRDLTPRRALWGSAVSPLFVGAAAIAAGLLISSALSPVPGLGFRVTLREALLIGLACRLATVRLPARRVNWLLGAYVASASIQAALTLRQYFSHPPDEAGLAGRAAMIGTMGNPEYVASWLAPALAIALLWVGAGGLRLRARLGLAAAIALLGGSIVMSGGRGATVGLLAALALTAMLSRAARRKAAPDEKAAPSSPAKSRRAKRPKEPLSPAASRPAAIMALRIVSLGAVAFTLIATAFLMGREVRRQSLAGRMIDLFDPYSVSIRHRVGLMVVTSEMIAENPLFGAGPGRFGVEFDAARGRLAAGHEGAGPWAFNEVMSDRAATEAHCDPLQWWAEYGLLPFLGLMLIEIGAAGALIARVRAGGAPPATRLLLVALLTLAVGMLFSFPLHRPARAVLFWTLAGLAYAPETEPHRPAA